MKITRIQLRRLINEALGDKLKDAAGKVKSKIDQAKGGSQQATSSSSANKSPKDQAQDMVDEDPANRAMGQASLKKYYGDKGPTTKAAIKDAKKNGGAGFNGALQKFKTTDNAEQIIYVVVEKG